MSFEEKALQKIKDGITPFDKPEDEKKAKTLYLFFVDFIIDNNNNPEVFDYQEARNMFADPEKFHKDYSSNKRADKFFAD
jgi:hypothetical protein